jgi:uncharacterized protein
MGVKIKWAIGLIALLIIATSYACVGAAGKFKTQDTIYSKVSDSNVLRLCKYALNQTKKHLTYDGTYRVISYPNGDVPDSLGVCTDVVIRAYRKMGYDLQKLVHEDMKKAYLVYEKRRHNDKIDANIDHRRTPNLQTYFTRFGKVLPITKKASDYAPGDIVFWDVSAGHVGIVSNIKSMADTNRLMVIHNIGLGPKLEDFLFKAEITGHYKWQPWK